MRCLLLQHLSFSQVIYMVPISVDSPSMGVMEPNPDPGHLKVTTPAAAQPDAQGQLGRTAGTERAMQTPAPGEKGLWPQTHHKDKHQPIRYERPFTDAWKLFCADLYNNFGYNYSFIYQP